MALQLKLENTHTLSLNDTRLTLNDVTGNYNVTTNPTGYGTPNTPRNQIAVFILGLNKTSKGDIVTSLNSYNPLTSSTYSAVIGVDGWYQFKMIGLAIYNSAMLQSYDAGIFLYDSTTAKIVRITEIYPNPSNTSITANAAIVTELSSVSSQYTVATTDEFIFASNAKIKVAINGKISDLIANKVGFEDKRLIRQKDNYNAVRAVLQGAIYEFQRGNKYVAQTSMEFLNTNDYLKD